MKLQKNKRRIVSVINLHSEIAPNVPELSLENGIIKIVEILNGKGLITEMSCEGHSGVANKERAWIQLNPSSFKSYLNSHTIRMEQFLKAGEGKWHLRIEYSGKSLFSGLGSPQPRKRTLKRIVEVEMEVSIILNTTARFSKVKTKTKMMLAMERAAKKYL